MIANTDRGIVLLAHGARDPLWARPFEAVHASLCASLPGRPIELAYLEFIAPGLLEAGARLAACSEVVVVPLFLGAGGHVRKDVPALLERLRLDHPACAYRLTSAIGEHPALIAALVAAALDLANGP